MRKLAIVVAVAAALGSVSPASSAPAGFPHEGSIQIGHVAVGVGVGVTQLAGPCARGGATDKIDGEWWPLSGHVPVFTATPAATLDIDIAFFDANCNFIDVIGAGDTTNDGAVGGGTTQFGETESANVPNNAAWAHVDGYAGTGNYTFWY